MAAQGAFRHCRPPFKHGTQDRPVLLDQHIDQTRPQTVLEAAGRAGGSAPTPGCGAIRPTPSTGSCGDICGLRSRPTPHELSCLTPFERYDGGGQGLRHSLRMTEGVAAAMRPAGEAEIVDVVRQSGSPWFFGPLGFVLKNARPLPFMPCRGQLGFFDVDYRP